MNAVPPFNFGATPPTWIQNLLSGLRPPQWLSDELHNRLLLLLNHVLQQEPEAMARLRRQHGKPVRVVWGATSLTLQASPAGLLERSAADAKPELTVTLTDAPPFGPAQRVLAGERPRVDIQGDVQLAAEVAWLSDNVRWEIEEDLARLIGDAPAHTLCQWGRQAFGALRALVARRPGGDTARPVHPSRAPGAGDAA